MEILFFKNIMEHVLVINKKLILCTSVAGKFKTKVPADVLSGDGRPPDSYTRLP